MKYFLPLVTGLLLSLSVSAQRKPLVEGNFTKTPFEEFVKSLEQQTGYQFFFDPTWTDSLKVTTEFRNKTVEEALALALADTELKFIVTKNRSVFLSFGREIMAELPSDYFNADAPVARTDASFDFSDYESREKRKKLAEAKLYSVGIKTSDLTGTATITGKITDQASGEPLIGASIYIEKPMTGAATDPYGTYSLTLPRGRHQVVIKSIGMKSTVRQVMLYGNGRLDIELEEEITPLKEVVVEAERDARVSGLQMGMEKLDIRTMKQMPLALGETDIMKVVLALPGVQSVGEGTVGLNVRGGASNQNLILFNDAVVYNPSHLFGFFSTFNPDVLKNVELYKSGITADYGGRLSSVLDVKSREGNLKKFSGSGGISPITGRLTIEGPLLKDRTSFILGARSTYSSWLLRQLRDESLSNSTASFYDVTMNVSHKINDDNHLYISGYYSKDKFQLNGDTVYSYSDRNASIKWKSIISPKFHAIVTASYSNYAYAVASDENPVEASEIDFGINQLNGKIDLQYYPGGKHSFTGGVQVTRYGVSPGQVSPVGSESQVRPLTIESEQGYESAAYIGDNIELSSKLSVYGGVRYSMFHYLGQKDVFVYASGPRERANIIDTLSYGKGQTIASYAGLEPRFSVRYSLSGSSSVKLSYNRMRQYIQMLSNTTAIAPTDIWKLSDQYVRPQVGDQYAVGFYKNFKGNLIETSVEAYYKDISNTIDFKDGATLLKNQQIETDIIDAEGRAYGVEFMIKKSSGKVNGWISYTWSRSLFRTIGQYSAEMVNRGEFYPGNFDKPHAVNFISNYKFSRRFNVSWNVVYSSGRPITIPIARYVIDGTERVLYGDRNAHRIPYYLRTDLSINVEGNHKIRKLAHSSWTFAVYNLLGRANPYSVFFVTEQTGVKGYQLSVFAQPIPTITYNFKF